MQAIALPDEVLKSINSMMFKFIWKKKFTNRKAFEKVKRDVLCQDYENGGLKMLNVFDVQNSFLIQWVRKLISDPQSNVAGISRFYYDQIGSEFSIFKSNVTAKHFIGWECIKSVFWQKVLKTWLDMQPVITIGDIAIDDIPNQVLWNNSLIKFKGNVLMMRSFIQKEVIYVSDLFLDNHLLSLDNIAAQMNIPANQLCLRYNAIFNAIPEAWKQSDSWPDQGNPKPSIFGRKISMVTSKFIRTELVEKRKHFSHLCNQGS